MYTHKNKYNLRSFIQNHFCFNYMAVTCVYYEQYTEPGCKKRLMCPNYNLNTQVWCSKLFCNSIPPTNYLYLVTLTRI